ncbi:MAG: polysaccharide deacetylase family protein [Oscillospiraceae bacterium]|nr:polysaccharide deacetylase family protein [Oscillospiraceae bacterium]
MTQTRKKTRRRGRTLWIALAGLLLWLLLMAATALILDGRTVRFYVFGENEMTIEFGSPYVEPGIYAVTAGKLFGESQTRLPLHTEGNVDSGRLGTYVLRYTVHYAFSDYSVERRVNVVDTTPPVIELKHIEGYEPTWMTGYAEEGYVAYDACDGDLTGYVLRTRLEDRVLYSVSDSSGNMAHTERMLPELNYQPPVITLLGDANTVIQARLWYQDPGASVLDARGNDLSDYLVTDGAVTPWLTGDYRITYSLTSEYGETISASRNVRVVPVGLPETVTPAEKTIYLTFDDGPGPYTERLLEVLDRYGAKATFFVTAQDDRYLDQIGRAFRAGHSIGVHSSSHNYNYIYASEQDFFDDFFSMEEIIYQQTGSYTQLFRFPGGSSNTVSSFNPGIMTRLSKIMNDLGYQFFDWNVSSGDAGETTSTAQVIRNIEDGCSGKKASVVLQHDIKEFSVAAVESVLQWGQANGYSFKALQLDSPGAHHGLNN